MSDTLYKDLAPDTIRLLLFLDHSGRRCVLEEHNLKEAAHYWTLSYTWNDEENLGVQDGVARSHHLEVNGIEVEIQSNLSAAFRHIAPRAYDLKKYVWADYICINQADEAEKSSQVQMMKDIYAKAKVVRAWLGLPRDENNVRLAVEMITSIGQTWRRGSIVYPGDIDLEMRDRRPGFPTDKPQSVATWKGIAEIFGKPFWQRTWCHLECSKNDVRFYCGEHNFDSFDFRILGTAIHVYQRLPGFDQQLRFIQASRLFNARCRRDEEKSLRMLPLLSEIRPTVCADARDKVFAALPHAVDVFDKTMLSVDYSKDLLEVYTDVVKWSLQHDNGLGILGYVSTIDEEDAEKQRPVMPSWVPDWRATNVFISLTDGKDRTSYNPCPGTSITATIVGPELHLQGYPLDTIAAVTDAGYKHGDIFAATLNWVQQLEDHGMRFPDSVFHRTVTGNALMGMMESSQEEVYKRWDDVDWKRVMNPQTAADEWNRDHIRDVLHHFCLSRKLGYTSDATQLGLFPLNARIGDSVVAFEGGKTLYVVRSLGDHAQGKFQFVGECYVNGLMDGLIMELVREQNSPSESFVLV